MSARTSGRAILGVASDARLVGLIGRLEAYKGTDELLRAATNVTDDGPHVVIAGECTDVDLTSRLQSLAADHPYLHVIVRRLDERELADLMAALDVMVLPFRRVTTSGSAITALGAGVPLALPRDCGLSDLPPAAVYRYDELGAALTWAATADADELQAMSRAAVEWSGGWTWRDVAMQTRTVYEQVLAR